MSARVYVESYGCQMNLADSELLLGQLARQGYAEVRSPSEADVILVNTCAIREHAEERVIGRLTRCCRTSFAIRAYASAFSVAWRSINERGFSSGCRSSIWCSALTNTGDCRRFWTVKNWRTRRSRYASAARRPTPTSRRRAAVGCGPG